MNFDGGNIQKLFIPSSWQEMRITGFTIHPEGESILLEAHKEGEGYLADGLYLMPLDGSSPPELIIGEKGVYHTFTKYSPDGSRIFFTHGDGDLFSCDNQGEDVKLLMQAKGWNIIQDIK